MCGKVDKMSASYTSSMFSNEEREDHEMKFEKEARSKKDVCFSLQDLNRLEPVCAEQKKSPKTEVTSYVETHRW